MKEYIEKAKAWITANKTIAGVLGAVLLFVVFKMVKRRSPVRRRRSLPRSVGMRKATRRAGSVNRIIKSGRNRGKKAWQIKGSEAARRHMAAIRRKRSKKLF